MVDQPSDLKGTKRDDFSIGSYDGDYFTLFYGMFVGQRGRIFSTIGLPLDLNIRQFQTAEFNFVFMWSFLNVPAYHAATSFQIRSYFEMNADENYNHELTRGWNEDECLSAFRQSRILTTIDLLRLASNDHLADKSVFRFVKNNGVFYRYGRGPIDAKYLAGLAYLSLIHI